MDGLLETVSLSFYPVRTFAATPNRLLAASNASHRTKDDVVTDRKVATFYPDDGRSNA